MTGIEKQKKSKKSGWYKPTEEMYKRASKGCQILAECFVWGSIFIFTFPALCISIFFYVHEFIQIYHEEEFGLIIVGLFLWIFADMQAVYFLYKKIQQYVKMKRGDFFVRTVLLNKVIREDTHHGRAVHDYYVDISYIEDGKKVSKIFPFNTIKKIKELRKAEGTEITIATVDYYNMVVLDKVYPEMR